MFSPIKGGTVEVIQVDFWGEIIEYKCWIPPVGYGINVITGELERTDVIKRSNRKADQYFERIPLPDWWKEKRRAEERRQKSDPEYIDHDCEEYRQQEWGRRLRGFWFYNNGIPVYITGLHWFCVNWWRFQGKWLSYRNSNRRFFYVWQYCVEDPDCLGLIECTKRKEGKTARLGCIIYEYISRTNSKHGGIQSKNDVDAQEVFDKAIIQPWKQLPDFYRPVYDVSKGSSPKSELRFFKPSVRGLKALNIDDSEKELQSFIDFKPSNVDAYDGPELHVYGCDEASKLKDISIVERHSTVRFCSEVDGQFVGKHIYTSTIEEMESGGGEFLKLVQGSNPNKRNANRQTKTGLYIYMLPAYETLYYDKYGMPDEVAGRQYYMNTRESLAGDEKELQSFIRKNPFSLAEAFKIDGSGCHYNAFKLTERDSVLAAFGAKLERGNFMWENGRKNTRVVWEPNPAGRWEVSWMPEEKDRNLFEKDGTLYYPRNIAQFISGSDTYDHDDTEDSRNSKAASFVKRRMNPMGEDGTSRKYICKYNARPPLVDDMYEDLLMQSVFFGCGILCENNKPGILQHFKRRGFGPFLIQLPGYKEPGIPSTQENKREASLMVEAYIEREIHKMDFRDQIFHLLKFNIKKTTKWDLAMATLWTEYADNYRYFEVEAKEEELVEADQFMRTYGDEEPIYHSDQKAALQWESRPVR
jgi:hypothetical protein